MSVSGILVACKGKAAQRDHIEFAQRLVTVLITRNQGFVMLELFLGASDDGFEYFPAVRQRLATQIPFSAILARDKTEVEFCDSVRLIETKCIATAPCLRVHEDHFPRVLDPLISFEDGMDSLLVHDGIHTFIIQVLCNLAPSEIGRVFGLEIEDFVENIPASMFVDIEGLEILLLELVFSTAVAFHMQELAAHEEDRIVRARDDVVQTMPFRYRHGILISPALLPHPGMQSILGILFFAGDYLACIALAFFLPAADNSPLRLFEIPVVIRIVFSNPVTKIGIFDRLERSSQIFLRHVFGRRIEMIDFHFSPRRVEKVQRCTFLMKM